MCYLNSFASLLETNFTKNTHPQSSNMPMVAPSSMMHKCDKMGSAPTSDVARRNNARAMPLPARWCHVQFFFFFFRYAPICANLGRISSYRLKSSKHTDSSCTDAKLVDSGRNSKKKKKKKEEKVQNAPSELNNKTLNYLSSQPDSFFNLQLSLTLCAP